MGAAGIHTVSGFILRVWDGAELGPSAEKIWKETVDKDSEAAAAKKSATGGDRAWRGTWARREEAEGTEDFSGNETTLYDTVMVDTCH